MTGKKSRVFIRMIDKSKMIIRPDSEVLLKELVYVKRNRPISKRPLS